MKNAIFAVLFISIILFSTPLPAQQTTPLNSHAITPIIPDFQVNENAGPNGAIQYSPCVATFENGNYVITWYDYRNGDTDIYAQLYSKDGNPIGNNFKVNDDKANAGQYHPDIATNGNDTFIITWHDSRDGDDNIYAQRYSADGEATGPNFKINDDDTETAQSYPSICMDNTGKFIITWEDQRNEEHDIYAQCFSAQGNSIGANFKVNDEYKSSEQNKPSITVDGNGRFMITWQDSRNGNYDVYAQRYASDGSPVGTNFRVNDDEGQARQYRPVVSADSSGNFTIAWYDKRRGLYDIYAQCYAADGRTKGTNFEVTDEEDDAHQYYPSICTAKSSGNFIITWRDERNDNDDIYAQRFSAEGSTIGSNFKMNDDSGHADQKRPDIAIDSHDNFVITWYDYRNGDPDIYAQRYTPDGNTMATNFKVNDDQHSAGQYDPSMAIDANGDFIITWEDNRNGNLDIYAQRYSVDGNALSTNFKVNDDTRPTRETHPAIAADSAGNFMITWQDSRNGNYDIYAQRYSADGVALNDNFKVNDNAGSTGQYSSAVAADGQGRFIVTWRDKRNESNDIYAQRYSTDGMALGSNFKVNEDLENASHRAPAISADSNGRFVITWYRYYDGNHCIYGQRFSSNGEKTGNNFKVNDDMKSASRYYPDICSNADGDFVTWSDKRNGELDIYAQRYAADGSTIGNNFKVNDDEGDAKQYRPKIAVNSSGRFIISWWDNRNEAIDIYAQRYLADGSQLGTNFRVTNIGDKKQFDSDVKLYNDRIYNTWRDNRTDGKGYDIWANVLNWEGATGMIVSRSSQQPAGFVLYPNYPNPFNPGTTIRYELSHAREVNIAIFNMLGQKIVVLENTHRHPGLHTVQWNGTDEQGKSVPAGVYVCRIKTGAFEQSIKLMLLK